MKQMITIEVKNIYYPFDDSIKDYLTSGKSIKEYQCERKNQASPIVIKWIIDNKNVYKQTFKYSLNKDFSYSKEITLSNNDREVNLFNLFKASTYYFKLAVVINNKEYIEQGTFQTADLGPRIMNIEGIYNVRDVGGYMGFNHQRTRQGLLYRGGALTKCSDHYYDGLVGITEKGKKTLSEELKIKTEFDIRKEEEALFLKKSLIPGATLKYLPTNGYLAAFDESEGYRDVFKGLANKDNYPIYMHCTGGADRTGTVCFILNALLGVSEKELIQDYEITTFSLYGIRDSKSVGTPLAFCEFFERFKKDYEGASLREKAIHYLLSIGVTEEEIDSLEKIFIK